MTQPAYTMADCPQCETAGPHMVFDGGYGCAVCSFTFGQPVHPKPRGPLPPEELQALRNAEPSYAADRKPKAPGDLSSWLPGSG